MKTFNPINRPIQPSYTLDVLAKSYNTLEQGHKEAVKAASDLEVAMANLDLNEAESEWRQSKINEIRQTVDENTVYGNAYTALDDIIKKAGNIASDQGMIGRLKAQQDYKTFRDQLDKRTDIPEDYKEYYRELNPYKYQDQFNKEGQIIGGTKWEPSTRPVSTVPLDKILSQGLSWAAKEAGGSDQTRWLDANGNITNDISKSVTGEFFDTRTNSWQRLSKEKLAAGVQAAIEATPGAKASLEQDYNIAKWKYNKNGEVNPDITDKNGVLLTPNEYIQKRIDPFYKAATYYNQNDSTKYGDAWKAQLAMANKMAAQGGNFIKQSDILQTVTNPVRMDNFMPTQAQAEITSNKQSLANIIKTYNPDAEFDLDNSTQESIRKLIEDNISNPEDRLVAIQNLETIADNQEYLESVKEGSDPDDAKGFDAYNAVISMSDLPLDNEYSTRVSSFINGAFRGNSAVRGYVNEEQYDEIIMALGGERQAESLGFVLGSKNGKKYIEIPKNSDKALYSYATAFKNVGALGRWSGTDTNFVTVDDNGNELEDISSPVGRGGIYNPIDDSLLAPKGFKTNIKRVLDDYVDYVGKLKIKNDNVLKGGKITLGQQVVNQATPAVAEAAFMMKANPSEAGKYSALYKLENEEAVKGIRGIDLTQTGAMVVGENNTFEKVTSDEAKKFTALLRSVKDNEMTISAVQDPQTGIWSPLITLHGVYDAEGKEKRQAVTLYAPGGFDSAVVQSWNQDSEFRAKNDVNIYSATNRNLNITNSRSFANIDKLILQPSGNGFEVFNKTDNKKIGLVDKTTAVELRDAYYRWNDTYNAVKSGVQGIDMNSVASIAVDVARALSRANNDNNVEYYYQQLMLNLTR
jgi:hypothetical protein